MRLQHVFNLNWKHFIERGNPPGFDPVKGGCVYVGKLPDGRPVRCAIGVCFPPEWTDATLGADEIYTIDELVMTSKPVARLFEGMDDKPLVELQGIHDEAAWKAGISGDDFTRIYKRKLLDFAEKWLLDVPEELVAA